MWNSCKNILCIRADNMGDLIMTGPALKAIKDSFGCRMTVLTSRMAKPIAPYIPVIDEVIVRDLPWVKTGAPVSAGELDDLITEIRNRDFDGAIVFTVYSQSALPAAMLALMAGIPLRAAYSRENPYDLLTNWIPDPEPYGFVQHQVLRDLGLAASIGATVGDNRLLLTFKEKDLDHMQWILSETGIDPSQPYILFHPGVSEEKRRYPVDQWIELGKRMAPSGYPILVTGTAAEGDLTGAIASGIGDQAYDMAGRFNIGGFIALTDKAAAVVSVNTGTIHIAAALQTPLIVLYALTNPQHIPWKVPAKIFAFDVPENLQSKSEVIRFVREYRMIRHPEFPEPAHIADALRELLMNNDPEPVAPDALIRN